MDGGAGVLGQREEGELLLVAGEERGRAEEHRPAAAGAPPLLPAAPCVRQLVCRHHQVVTPDLLVLDDNCGHLVVFDNNLIHSFAKIVNSSEHSTQTTKGLKQNE